MSYPHEKFLSFDLETASHEDRRFALQPFRCTEWRAEITTYAISWFDFDEAAGKWRVKSTGRIKPERAHLAEVLHYAIDTGRTIVGWNVSFDAAWLVAMGLYPEVIQAKWSDAMLLWQHLEREPEYGKNADHRRSYSLKEAVRQYIPKYAGYEDDVDYQDTSPEGLRRLLKYNRCDTNFTLLLHRLFYRKLKEQDPRQLRNAQIEAAAIPPVANTMVQGLCVDTDAAHTLGSEIEKGIDELYAGLKLSGADDKILASPIKLRKLLYEDWGLPVTHTTPKGAPSTDKVALHWLAAQDPRARTIKEYRELQNNRTKFVEKVLDSVGYNGDGRTRPGARIYGTYTGRMTFASKQGRGKEEVQTGFAIHQMKSAPEYRRIITAPEGYVLCEWDAAGQEYRWMAVESGDETMQSLCMPGEDPHSYMGSGIAHLPYEDIMALQEESDDHKQARKMGKVGNLSCQFRIGWKKLHVQANVQFGMPLTPPEAQLVHRTYHSTYPGVKQYWLRQINKAKRLGYVETLAGRRVQLDPSAWNHPDLGWKQESTSVNFPIQGIGADQKYLAIKVLMTLLPKWGGYYYFELHDGLYAILPEKVAMKAGLEIRDTLSRLPYKKAWGFEPPVPMPWDLKIGPNWGDMREVKDG